MGAVVQAELRKESLQLGRGKMKSILGLSLLLAVVVAASATRRNSTHFFTNSYMHTEERPFPLNRPNHSRTPKTSSCFEDSACRATPFHPRMEELMRRKLQERSACKAAGECPRNRPFMAETKCQNGMAGDYECNNIDMLSFTPISELGSTYEASDSWGWTDPETGDEIAIIGMEDGTAFVQITDPVNPIVLGFLPQSGYNLVIWSDMKVFANHVFIVRESMGHGMQVMDLTKLRAYYGKSSKHAVQLTQDALYSEITSTHNGGIHAVDINQPTNPTYAGCFDGDGYVHDAQCVIYSGPASRYTGSEICFNYNEDTLTIVDVSDKANMKMLSRVGYDGSFYTHQGWLNKDMSHLMLNDELDEQMSGNQHTRTMMWSVEDLENPKLVGSHYADVLSIDHNLYVRDDLAYLTNYCSGLRILDATQMASGVAPEMAFFDAADYCDAAIFMGTWSNYPFFESGNVVVSSIELGLFVLRPDYAAIGK